MIRRPIFASRPPAIGFILPHSHEILLVPSPTRGARCAATLHTIILNTQAPSRKAYCVGRAGSRILRDASAHYLQE